MATDTLGARIQEMVFDWVAAGDVLGWGNPRVQEMRAAFVALAARADAAERLAVVVEWCDDDGWEFASDRYNQYHEALAAWRAITEEAQP